MTISYATDSEQFLLSVRSTDLHVTPEQFDRLCFDNPDLRLELTANGELIIMAPTFGESGEKNVGLVYQIADWNYRTELGKTFDSSTGYDFTAIGGGKMSPDVSWIEKSRIDGVSLRQFIPVVPDFVVELRSTTDRLSALQSKLLEYQRLGVKVGLLINPQDKEIEVYQLDKETEVIQDPLSFSCELILPGFKLDLTKIL
jgi:Uma2 family endonuclease